MGHWAWAVLGYQRNAESQSQRALDLAGGLPHEEKLNVEGRYRAFAGEWNRAAEIYKSLWMVFPDQIEYGLRLIDAETAAGKGDEAFATVAGLRRLPSLLADNPRIDLAEAAISEAISDFKREQTAAVRAAEKAERVGARLLLANALLRDCWASNNLADRGRALAAARRAKDIFSEVGDPGAKRAH